MDRVNHLARHRSGRTQTQAAGHLVGGQLCRHRHDAADRRRNALRGRSTCAPASACSTLPRATATRPLAAARRWCDVVSTDYVAALLERARGARQRRGAGSRLPGSRRREPAVRRRLVRCRAVHLRRDVHAQTRTRRRANWRASASPAARSAWRTGRRRASSASCSRSSASTSRRPPGSGRRRSGAPKSICAELFGERIAQRIDVQPQALRLSLPLARSTGSNVFAPTTARCNKAFAALDADKKESLAADLLALARRFNRADDGSMVVPSDYLEAVIVTR